ncbi:MAG: aminoglycoside phosphotransferase family protein [Acidobacteriota bacterium]|nr:aminoglycoside phosphotransferase family protein [Acidobacteriota bacterium]
MTGKRHSSPLRAAGDLIVLFSHFAAKSPPVAIAPYGSGHIHETYRVRTRGRSDPGCILQRINTRVFPDVPRLMENIVRVTAHLRDKAPCNRPVLTVVPADDGRPFHRDGAGGFWRCFRFIGHREPGERFRGGRLAAEAGRRFGHFITQMADLPGPPLHETIRGFHDVDFHLGRFGDLLHADPAKRREGAATEIEFVRARAAGMRLIHDLGRAGRIPLRITHNDTKFNNILFDERGRGLCIIDLDTVMPGYVHYDFGDAIRSAANCACEDERALRKVGIDMRVFEEFTKGYLGELRGRLTAEETAHLAFAARLMTYMVGLRFLNDYLDGDRYFKTGRRGHNLQRARVHFRLLEDMERRSAAMEDIVSRLAVGTTS